MLPKILSLIKAAIFKLGNILLWLALVYSPFTKKVCLDELKAITKISVKEYSRTGVDMNDEKIVKKEIIDKKIINEVIEIMLLHNGKWRDNTMFIPTVEIFFSTDEKLVKNIWLGVRFFEINVEKHGMFMKLISKKHYDRLVELLGIENRAR